MAFGSPQDDDDLDIIEGNAMSDINMTPLIDVMLVLLIIFIITMPIITHSVQVELPQASNQPATLKPDIVTLSIDKAGQTYWNDTPIDETALKQRLADSAQQEPQPEIHIRGDRHAEYDHVIKAMAAAQQAGLSKLGFITQPDKP